MQNPPIWQTMRVLASYQPPWLHLIHQFKYGQRQEIAVLLSQLFCEALPAHDKPEVILPVPLHWWREWRRGFNQAELLGRQISRHSGIPLDTSVIRRHRATRPQASLEKTERLRNLKAAFRCSQAVLPYQHVALLDDVITTGATMTAITQVLQLAGVQRVDVWAICRTLPHAADG